MTDSPDPDALLPLIAAFDAFPDLFFRLDPEGTILEHRAGRAADLFHPRDSFIGERVEVLLPPSAAGPIMAALRRAHTTRELATVEYSLPMATGEEHYEARILPFGERQLVAIVRNVSERHRAAAALAQARQHLAEARDAERRRIARTLHDGAVQQLFGLGYAIDNLRYDLTHPPPRAPQRIRAAAARLEWLRREVVAVATAMRSLMTEVRPPMLEGMGLGTAIQEYARTLERQEGVSFAIQVEALSARLPLSDAVTLCLYRVVEEALRNVVQHAGAQRVQITLRREGAEALLHVRDDGRGFTVPDDLRLLTAQLHFGLVGMEERLREVGGRLVVRSAPGGGTELTAWAPLSAEAPDG